MEEEGGYNVKVILQVGTLRQAVVLASCVKDVIQDVGRFKYHLVFELALVALLVNIATSSVVQNNARRDVLKVNGATRLVCN